MVWRADRAGAMVAAYLQVVGALSSLGVVLASKLALDAIIGGAAANSGRLVVALVLMAAVTALSTSVGALQALQQRVLAERVDQVVRHRLLAATAAVDLVTWQSSDFVGRLERVRGNALDRPTQVVNAIFALSGALVGFTGTGGGIAGARTGADPGATRRGHPRRNRRPGSEPARVRLRRGGEVQPPAAVVPP